MTKGDSDKSVFLEGLALAGYRSFGSKIQLMGPFSQLNVFAGANNAGKSTILRFIHEHLKSFIFKNGGGRQIGFGVDTDCHYGTQPLITVGIAFAPSDSQLKKWFPTASGAQHETMKWLLEHQRRAGSSSHAWWFRSYNPDNSSYPGDIQYQKLPELAHLFKNIAIEQSPLWRSNSKDWKSDGTELRISNVNQLIQRFFEDMLLLVEPLPVTRYIPAFRRIATDQNAPPRSLDVYSGDGTNLARLYASIKGMGGRGREAAQQKVRRLEAFLRDVIGESKVELLVPHETDYFEVLRHKHPETLDVLGSGIGHLIMIGVAATLRENEIICIEEPELFLHPVLQRKLVEYLKTTTNQYFISTHSAQFLDVSGASVFHLEMSPTGTTVRRAETSSDRFQICRDLGYRASDIVQANCVIWVEGPSDLIYLRRWIGDVAPDLREGIEYSVMFYGGSLRSWLSGDDPEDAEELISLLAINRHCAIVMDRDRDNTSDPLNDQKRRVSDEVRNSGGFVWVTDGREIENYIPYEQRRRHILALKPELADSFCDSGEFGVAYPRTATNKPEINKNRLASAITGDPVEWGTSELKTRIEDVVRFIREANHRG